MRFFRQHILRELDRKLPEFAEMAAVEREFERIGRFLAAIPPSPAAQAGHPTRFQAWEQKAISRETIRACSTTGSDRGSLRDHDLTLIVDADV